MSSPRTRVASLATATVILLAACGAPSDPDPSASAPPPSGGTLRVGVPGDFPPPSSLASSGPAGAAALDPLVGFYDSLELMRCCVLRTLVSYVGRPTDEGGTVLQPDLAESLPEVSADGLTWTFHLRQGIRYAPPLDDIEVTSADVVRGLLRAFRLGGVEAGFSSIGQLGIEGVPEFIAGTASTVSGFETPDPYTLRIRLVRPAGDLPARFAVPDTAPIPPSPADPAAELGIATGHDADYGLFIVGTGPYMVEGSEELDLSVPTDQQVPVSGLTPGVSLTLVRNPSWDRATDQLRPAYVDRIEIAIGGTLEELSARVDDGELDLVHYAAVPPQAPLEQIARYDADPALGSVHLNSRDFIRAISLNLALPPFDDIHVRKAANLVIDKAGLIELAGGPPTGEVAGHLVLNSLEDNLLLSYDPYATPGSAGDPEHARDEMRLSSYDDDGDGRCDGSACSGITGVAILTAPGQAELVADNLADIGIEVDILEMAPDEGLVRAFDPLERVALVVGLPYGKDSLNAAPIFRSLFDSRWSMGDDFSNGTMVGASPERLAGWGYDVTEVPSIDDRIDACLTLVGGAMVQCWADLDQYLMENVVPWVPYSFERYARTVPPRIVHYSFDQFVAQPAFDQIALDPDD